MQREDRVGVILSESITTNFWISLRGHSVRWVPCNTPHGKGEEGEPGTLRSMPANPNKVADVPDLKSPHQIPGSLVAMKAHLGRRKETDIKSQ